MARRSAGGSRGGEAHHRAGIIQDNLVQKDSAADRNQPAGEHN